MKRTAFLLLLLAPGQAMAEPVNPVAAGEPQCFRRIYDEAHLAKNPGQSVREFEILFSTDAYDSRIAWVSVTFRDGPESYGNSLYCYPPGDDTGIYSCAVECDGGVFTVSTRGDDAILVRTERFVVQGGCGEEEGPIRMVRDDLPPGEETVYKLFRADLGSCPEPNSE